MIDIKDGKINSLDVYREVVRAMLKERRKGRISNTTTPHAIVLIEELLNSAKSKVDIYCKALSQDVWCEPGILQAIKSAYDRGVVFRVIVQSAPGMDNAAYKIFLDRNIEVRIDEQDEKYGKIVSNFAIVDDESFRFEENNNRREGFAYATRNAFLDALVQAFCKLYARSKPFNGEADVNM